MKSRALKSPIKPKKGNVGKLSELCLMDRTEFPASFEGKQMICHSVVVPDGVGVATMTLYKPHLRGSR